MLRSLTLILATTLAAAMLCATSAPAAPDRHIHTVNDVAESGATSTAITPELLLGSWTTIRNDAECTIRATRQLGDATIMTSTTHAADEKELERVYYSRDTVNNTWLRTTFHADGTRTTHHQATVAPPDTLTFEHAATNGVPVAAPKTRIILRRESEDLITFETQTASGHGSWTRGPVTIWKRTESYSPDDESIVAFR